MQAVPTRESLKAQVRSDHKIGAADAKIGSTFGMELHAAGLSKLPLAWNRNGITNQEALTAEQQAAVATVLAAHDPSKPMTTVGEQVSGE